MGFNSGFKGLNPICHLLALLGAHHFLHVSKIRVKNHRLIFCSDYIYNSNLSVYVYQINFLLQSTNSERSIAIAIAISTACKSLEVFSPSHLAAPVPYSSISCLSISDTEVNIFQFNNIAAPKPSQFLSVDINQPC